jgi:hypothetical protein
MALTRHYGFHPRACQPYRAKTKGKVERPFSYIRQDFFLARSFRDLDDLNAQLDDWLATIANVRVHGTTQRVVAEAFAAERPELQALPATRTRSAAAAPTSAARSAGRARDRWWKPCMTGSMSNCAACPDARRWPRPCATASVIAKASGASSTTGASRSTQTSSSARKNALFAGSDEGGANWATIASLIETCKLNAVNPHTWLTDTLTSLVDGWRNLASTR